MIKRLVKKILPKSVLIGVKSFSLKLNEKLGIPRGGFVKKVLFLYYTSRFSSLKTPTQEKSQKIVYLIPATTITGGIAVVCQHVNRLVKLGFDVSIVSKDNRRSIDWFPNFEGKVYAFSDPGWKKNIDIMVATSWDTTFDLMRIRCKRRIYFVQSDESRFYPEDSFERLEALLTYKINFEFMVEAKWIREWLLEDFNKDAYYVPMGLDKSIFYQTDPIVPKPKDKLRVLLEGAINLPYKGMEDAFSVVDGLDCEVWCVSNSGKPREDWHCDKFFEKVPMQQMREIYSSCDVLLKMSKVEGLFCPPLEMMSCGGANIVSKVSGYDEYIVDGQNAIVVDQGDINAARNALEVLSKDRGKLNLLIKNGYKTVKDWSWDVTVERLKEVYSLKT